MSRFLVKPGVTMKKKRKTKQQKIIAKLRRQLASQKPLVTEEEKQKYKEIETEKRLKTKIKLPEKTPQEKEANKFKKESVSNGNELFFYDTLLIKKDLIKTAIFSSVILAIIGIFYWGIELNGAKIIRGFFHL